MIQLTSRGALLGLTVTPISSDIGLSIIVSHCQRHNHCAVFVVVVVIIDYRQSHLHPIHRRRLEPIQLQHTDEFRQSDVGYSPHSLSTMQSLLLPVQFVFYINEPNYVGHQIRPDLGTPSCRCGPRVSRPDSCAETACN